MIFLKNYLLIALLLMLANTGQAQTLPKTPNIIIIYADDLGYGETEPYGQQIIKTPNLNKLADEGMKFTNFYAGSALCAPSRSQLLTGAQGGRSTIRGNNEMANGPASFTDALEKGQMPLPDKEQTIAEMLKPLGYATACIGKWGLGMNNTEGDPNKQGFDYFYGYLDQKQAHNYYPTHLWENGKRVELKNKPMIVHTKISQEEANDEKFNSFIGEEYSMALMASKASQFINTNKNQPFFLLYSVTLPHLALQIPPDELKLYEGKFEEKPYLGTSNYCPVKSPRATYAAMITYLDKMVGDIMRQLEEYNLRENTLLIFTSDNGAVFPIGGADPEYFNSNGPLRGYKGSLYEGGIRMPFIASWPGHIKPATVSNHIASQYDIKETLADILSIRSNNTDGISLLPALLGKKQPRHEFIYFELFEYGGQQAVRMGEWKAVRRNMVKDKNANWELYNLKNDTGESTDLASKYPDIIKRVNKIAIKSHQHHPSVSDWNFME